MTAKEQKASPEIVPFVSKGMPLDTKGTIWDDTSSKLMRFISHLQFIPGFVQKQLQCYTVIVN